jgi:hypothetical protein
VSELSERPGLALTARPARRRAISVRITADEAVLVRELADELGLTVSDAVRAVLTAALNERAGEKEREAA